MSSTETLIEKMRAEIAALRSELAELRAAVYFDSDRPRPATPSLFDLGISSPLWAAPVGGLASLSLGGLIGDGGSNG
jgi:hypothetical protein